MGNSVGIGAYIGVAQDSLLEGVSASILSVEARHSTYLRGGLNASVFPTASDTGLTSLWYASQSDLHRTPR